MYKVIFTSNRNNVTHVVINNYYKTKQNVNDNLII